MNCLMANRPADVICDAEPGSGKRIKTNLTGTRPFDLSFDVGVTGSVTEYFTYGKVTNQTNARVLGYRMGIVAQLHQSGTTSVSVGAEYRGEPLGEERTGDAGQLSLAIHF